VDPEDRKAVKVFRDDVERSARHFPRRVADSLLSQSKLLFELMDCVDELVLILDPALRVVKANRCASVYLGYPAGELLMKPLAELLDEGEGKRVADFVRSARGRRGGEAVFRTRQRRPVRVSLAASPLADEGAAPHGYLLVGRHATAGIDAEDASNGLAQRMLEGFAGPLFVVDGPSRTVRDCNDAAVDALGFAREELLGRKFFELSASGESGDQEEALMGRADEAYARAGIFQDRLLVQRKSGPPLPCDCTGLPFFKADGSLDRIVVMLFDRSSEEEREAELAGLIGRVNGLAAELTQAASCYSRRGEAARLSDLGFTQRQVEIARLVSVGASSKDIGFKLGIAESTVKNHLSVMFRKLGQSSRMGFMREINEQHIRIS